MPNRDDHLALAEHNQGVIDHLLTDAEKCADWIATVAFYKSVHLVEALFEADGHGHSGSHQHRGAVLKRENRYRRIYLHYSTLKEASLIARYLGNRNGNTFQKFTDAYTLEDVTEKLLNGSLQQLEQSVKKLLSKPRKRKPS